MTYTKALRKVLKNGGDRENCEKLYTMYMMLGEEELYDGMTTMAEDEGCDEEHYEALLIMEDGE